jgi:hypothetical protein
MIDTKGRYKISISYGTLSVIFTQNWVTLLEAKEIGEKVSRMLFQIEDVENVIMSIEELARYEAQKGTTTPLFKD